jgi:DNA phosphorothioation-dependent restriction protein DptG
VMKECCSDRTRVEQLGMELADWKVAMQGTNLAYQMANWRVVSKEIQTAVKKGMRKVSKRVDQLGIKLVA